MKTAAFVRMRMAIIGSMIGACLLTISASAATITYVTPFGATVGSPAQPVNASATFTTGSGTLQVTLTDLLANPKDVGQLISDLDFTLSGGQTTGAIGSSSGTKITVNTGGTTTLGSTGSTGWGLNNNVGGGLQLTPLGFPAGPAGLIIGPPGAGGVYTAANGSIAGNPAHNPFLNQTATFTLNIAGVTADSTVTSATFSFGTGADDPDVPGTVPDGSATVMLLGAALAGMGLIRKKLA
jgi:hypothetical protein